MRLYKYATPERIDILLNGVIRFTQPSALNDIFEFATPFAGLLPSWIEDELQSILNEYGQRYLGVAASLAVLRLKLRDEALAVLYASTLSKVTRVRLGDHLRRWLSRYVERHQPGAGSRVQKSFGKRFGVLSLSETATNVVMWSHYADSHRGLVFEIDVEEAFPERDDPSFPFTIGTPQKVVYDADRPAWFLYDPFGKPFGDQIENLFLRKNIQWQYEREWRLVYPLDRPKKYPHTVSGLCHLFPLVRAGVKGVIFGARASDKTASAVRNALTSVPDLNHVTLCRCGPSDTAYELVADRLDQKDSSRST